MATYSKVLLSGSTNGKAIPIVATSTPGTAIHTAQSGTTGMDEVWLYAANSSSSTARLTVEFGGTTDLDHIDLDIPGNSGLVVVCPGLVINNALEVAAYSDVTNVIGVSGYVNRITA